jgi:ankyrin repeat protein
MNLQRMFYNTTTPDAWGQSPLRRACSGETPDTGAVVMNLLDRGAIVDASNTFGWTALHVAVRNGKRNCVRVLLSRNATMDLLTILDWTPLAVAMKYSQSACARLLMDHGAQLNMIHKDINTPEWATAFVAGREWARHTGVILAGALKRVGMNRDLVPLIAQWVWATRGL